MTNHTGRLYALALMLVVFFIGWAAIAARPWAQAATDPRLVALNARAAQLKREAAFVNQIVALRAKNPPAAVATAAAAPAVKVVNLPPLTVTRTS